MIQIYFLSVFLNALTGYALITSEDQGALGIKGGFSLSDETVRLVLGILAMVTGLLKLLSPVEGDLPILGDLVPGILGLFAGFALVFEYYRSHTTVETEQTEKMDQLLSRNKKIIGFVAIVSGALHFLFPGILLL
jgi:hypothetical protein